MHHHPVTEQKSKDYYNKGMIGRKSDAVNGAAANYTNAKSDNRGIVELSDKVSLKKRKLKTSRGSKLDVAASIE